MTVTRTVVVYALLWALCLIIAAGISRSLFGDGAMFVLFQLQNPQHFLDYDTQRSFASHITQALVLFGEHAGVKSVATFASLYSVGTFALPALLFVLALYLSKDTVLLFAATAGAIVIFGFGVNFINTEANLFFGSVWLCIVMLYREGTNSLLRGLLLPLIAFVLLRVYEGMLLVGPILALWCVFALRRTADTEEKIGLGLAALLFLLGAVIGFGGFLSPRDPGNAGNFVGTMFAYLFSPQAYLLLSVIAIFPIMRRPESKLLPLFAIASAVFAFLFLAEIAALHGYSAYGIYYGNRAFLVISITAAAAVLFVLAVISSTSKGSDRAVAPIPAKAIRLRVWVLIPFIAVVVSDLVGSFRWFQYMGAFCTVLQSSDVARDGLRLLQQSGVMTGWSWTHPTLSVLLRDKGSNAMVYNAAGGGWQPFDPATPPSLIYSGVCRDSLLHDLWSAIGTPGLR